MREKIVAGNWKMNLNLEEAEALWFDLKQYQNDEVTVLAFPPSLYLGRWAQDQGNVFLGAQNVFYEQSGAFTGEIAPEMLKSLGIQYALVGHSERRTIFGESDDWVRRKVDALLEEGLKVIVCCGEPLEVRESGQHVQYVSDQIKKALWHLDPTALSHIIIAYEPVLAIGTGKTATPKQAQEMHRFIRELITEQFGAEGNIRPILYGGSCKPENAKEIFAQEDVDGGLIGGASLKYNDFKAIIDSF